ncbi:probable disease resistance protein At5g47260 [Vigna unguiculata]|uniref:Disease resistance protein RPM1 n=1 Tax=Vigna unguiculata TaxID=3917 RepID=A0A4D6NF75_VIGUN|nr:probable disease resistance protein At5g47260 [Vigna unguiculata]QCE12336.1 disease resistance protein RPM1 [Vigna unguiculata]
MSIRTNKMKAIPVLLKQLMIARRKFHERGRDESFDRKLEKLRSDLKKIEDVFVRVKKKEEVLLDTLAEVYDHLRKLDRGKLDEDMDGICQRIRDSAHNLLPILAFDDSSKDEDHIGGQIFHPSEELWQAHERIRNLENLYYSPDNPSTLCLSSLFIFPENAVIRKRNAINLWIGEGLIGNTENKRAEEEGEDVIDDLLKCGVIVRCGNGKDPSVNRFQIFINVRHQMELYLSKENGKHQGQYFIPTTYPQIRVERLELERKKATLGGDDWYFGDRTIGTIFNIGASYLNFRPKWVTELKNLLVLQLGRWQDSALHHIEVGSQEFLKELRNLKQLRYLSLRGISRIFELPSSIVELESLLVLDLKACHNLETLPDDISTMKSLTHLILSECCFVEGMPKGIEKLTNLQVLKGFLISRPGKTPCRISELVKLRKLRGLSIHIGSEAVIRNGEFERLEDFFKLEQLKISWNVSDPKYANINIIVPPHLKKLHLECFPGKSFVECFMPSKWERAGLESTLELNITGGKLESIKTHLTLRTLKILRLKYLKQLNVDIDDLKALFPRLKYVEIKQISNHSYIEHEWGII